MADTTFPIIRLVLNETQVEFINTDVLECIILQEFNPISAELPVSTASVLVFTTDPRFSIYSDGIFYQSLTKNTPVQVLVSVDGVEQPVGYFFLDSWEMETENTLRFELVDILGVCANIQYPGSFWETDTGFETVMTDVIKDTPAIWLISDGVSSRTVKGWIPPGTVRDALQQVCFAARVTVVTDQYFLPVGILKFADIHLPEQSQYASYPTITDEEKTADQTVTHLPLITDVILISHDYYNLGEANQTVEEIYSAWLEPGNYIISYPKPYWKVWGEGVGSVPLYIGTEDDRVIVTEDSTGIWGDTTVRVATESETFVFSSNYVSIKVDVAGQITLWGYPWLSADRPHRYSDPGNSANTISVENAMLISAEKAPAILAKIVEYYQLRYKKNFQIFPKTIMLRNIYTIDSFRDKQLLGVVERLETNLSSGNIIDVTATGMEYIPPV